MGCKEEARNTGEEISETEEIYERERAGEFEREGGGGWGGGGGGGRKGEEDTEGESCLDGVCRERRGELDESEGYTELD